MDEVPRTSSGPPSTTSTSTADVWRGSIHYAKAVMERREGEISSMYDQLHEIEDDLTSMNNQVGKVSSTLQHCNNQVTQQHRRRCNQQQQDASHRPPMMSSLYQSQSVSSLNCIQQPNSSPFSSFASSSGRNQQRRSAASNANAAWSCRNLNGLTEDEMADIVHRLLTRICEFTLARQEGRNDIPLIV
jgi:chromosome segregation ATPase